MPLVPLLALAGCATPPAPHGVVPATVPQAEELVQTTIDRLTVLSMQANLQSLYRIMEKLYRRNPSQWRKGGADSADAAARQVQAAIEARAPWPALQGRRDIDALSLALSPDFAGDRVAAVVYAAADMLVTAYGGRTRFTILDRIEPQYVYNGARNIEILVWMLAQRRDAAGRPLLLADEISGRGRNLSFEREFGKIIGRLDLLAVFATERYRRAVINYVHSVMAIELLQFLPVR